VNLHLSLFLQVYSVDSSLFLYADSKVTTVTCSLSRFRVKLVNAPIFHSSMVSVDLIRTKIEDPVFLSKQ
jgi:hypothetical protein